MVLCVQSIAHSNIYIVYIYIYVQQSVTHLSVNARLDYLCVLRSLAHSGIKKNHNNLIICTKKHSILCAIVK